MGNPGSDRGPAAWHPRRLFREENAGLLLDVTVFVANLLVMDPLARAFIVLVQRVDAGDRAATTTLAVFFAALFVLMPAGALLKERGIGEPEAYALLRTAAMSENRRIADVARSVVSAARLLK